MPEILMCPSCGADLDCVNGLCVEEREGTRHVYVGGDMDDFDPMYTRGVTIIGYSCPECGEEYRSLEDFITEMEDGEEVEEDYEDEKPNPAEGREDDA